MTAEAIKKHALRFLEKHCTLEDIVDDNIKNETDISAHPAAAGLYLLGEHKKAFEILDEYFRWLEVNGMPLQVDQFMSFARALMKKMQADGWKPPAKAKAIMENA